MDCTQGPPPPTDQHQESNSVPLVPEGSLSNKRELGHAPNAELDSFDQSIGMDQEGFTVIARLPAEEPLGAVPKALTSNEETRSGEPGADSNAQRVPSDESIGMDQDGSTVIIGLPAEEPRVAVPKKALPSTEETRSGEPGSDPDAQRALPNQGIETNREASTFVARLPAIEPFVVLPKGLPTAKEIWSGEPGCDPNAERDAQRGSPNQGIGIDREGSYFIARLPPAEPFVIVPKALPSTEETRSGEPGCDPNAERDAQRGSPNQGIGMGRQGSIIARSSAEVPFVLLPKGLSTAEEIQPGEPGCDPNAIHESSNQRMGREGSVRSPGLRAPEPSICISSLTSLPSGLTHRSERDQPSVGRRRFRRVARFCVVALISMLIGVAASSAWESHADKIAETVRTLAPALGSFSYKWQPRVAEAKRIVSRWAAKLSPLFPLSTKAALGVNIEARQTGSSPTGQGSQDAALQQSAPVTPKPVSFEVPISGELAQQLEAMGRNLTVMQHKVEQLAAAQEQMGHDVASLEAADRNARKKIRRRMATPPLSSAAPLPPRKNATRAEPPLQPLSQMQISRQAIEQRAPPDDNQKENAQLPPRLRRQVVDYRSREAPGTIIVDTPHTLLYYILGHGKAIRYGIGVGREGYTWSGVKHSEWPDWYPPPEMITRQPYLPRMVAGGPGNPLGARALYIGGTEYRIHGTNHPSSIGKFMSSGFIRLTNDNIRPVQPRADRRQGDRIADADDAFQSSVKSGAPRITESSEILRITQFLSWPPDLLGKLRVSSATKEA